MIVRLLDRTQLFRRRTVNGYALAVAAFAVALITRIALDTRLPAGFPFVTFLPAIVIVAFVAGARAGAVCAALSGIAAWYLFIPPTDSFELTAQGRLALLFYLVIVSINIVLIHYLQIAADRLRAAREVMAGLYDQQRTMFQELQHRVANNMAFVASLLQLQKQRVAADPSSAPVALDEATRRIQIMSQVHRRLYDPAAADVPLQRYLTELCGDLVQIAGTGAVTINVEAPDIRIEIGRLTTVSLLVTELVTNSLKHAFPGRAPGTIRLSLSRTGSHTLRLTVSDDGCGLPPGHESRGGSGLGTLIAESLAQQLDGTLRVASGGGTTATLDFPV